MQKYCQPGLLLLLPNHILDSRTDMLNSPSLSYQYIESRWDPHTATVSSRNINNRGFFYTSHGRNVPVLAPLIIFSNQSRLPILYYMYRTTCYTTERCIFVPTSFGLNIQFFLSELTHLKKDCKTQPLKVPDGRLIMGE